MVSRSCGTKMAETSEPRAGGARMSKNIFSFAAGRRRKIISGYFSNFFKISAMTSGLALPRVSRITAPTRNCKDASLPFL